MQSGVQNVDKGNRPRRTPKRFLIELLDRPGGRTLLGKMATRHARRLTGEDLEILHDKFWVHRVGPYYFPSGTRFRYYNAKLAKMIGQADRYLTDAREYWFTHYNPRPGDLVIDVGAGQGEDALAFAQAVGDSGRVIAIEAHPLSFALLEKFCKLNRLENVTPMWLAIMDQVGEVSIIESNTWVANEVVRTNGEKAKEVPATTLDDLCEQNSWEDIAFLKMNIEGAERHAMQGMTSMIRRVKTICVACHDFRADHGHGEHFRTRSFVEQFLTEHGFTLTSRPDDPRDYVRDHIFGFRTM